MKYNGMQAVSDEIRWVKEDEGHRYLGIHHDDKLIEKEMREKISKVYKGRLKKGSETKRNGDAIAKTINIFVMPESK